MALRGPRAYLGKVKKSQGVNLRLSALKFKIKIRRAIWPPANLNRVKVSVIFSEYCEDFYKFSLYFLKPKRKH